MRVLVKLEGEKKYTTYIDGAVAEWEDENDKENRATILTLYGVFPYEGQESSRYIMHLKTDIGFSLVKKLEKEGTADLTTDYVRGLIASEKYE